MANKYIIRWDYVDNKGIVHQDNSFDFVDRDEANKAWVIMKNNPCYANLRHETKLATKRVVGIEFIKHGKVYKYETDFAVKEGDDVVVIDNNNKKIVVQAVTNDYEETEEELSKEFDISRLKKIFGIVVTK